MHPDFEYATKFNTSPQKEADQNNQLANGRDCSTHHPVFANDEYKNEWDEFVRTGQVTDIKQRDAQHSALAVKGAELQKQIEEYIALQKK